MFRWRRKVRVAGRRLRRWARGRARRHRGVLVAVATSAALVGLLAVHEARTSALQARFLSAVAARLTYEVAGGRSASIVFPDDGPFDRRRGYAGGAALVARLEERGLEVVEQSRFSDALAEHARRGRTPPVRFPVRAGLRLRGARGVVLYEPPAETVFDDLGEVPALLRQALLYVENRQLLQPADPRKNPAIEWPRLIRAGLAGVFGAMGFETARQGGSTLATQIEKYRHSPGGRTESVGAKLDQLLAASLRAYRDGPDTTRERAEILVDYLNSMPLSAAPGYGEVHGIGAGLRAWFGIDFEPGMAALADPRDPEAARVFRHALALVCAVREPSRFLLADRAALDARLEAFTRLMARDGILPGEFAERALRERTTFAGLPPIERLAAPAYRKPVDAARRELLVLTGAADFYQLDRMHLDADTTIDAGLQEHVHALLGSLRDAAFVREHGLEGPRLLARRRDELVYSFVLYERTPGGPLVRVQADTTAGAFDLNEDMKLELGSTAKLRTLTHYLELVAGLHAELSTRDGEGRVAAVRAARDPLTRWTARRLASAPDTTLASLLEAALERRYSADPAERFFTGGGVHRFHNFENRDDGKVLSVREATWRSTNLVFIRMMADLVAYHRARLPYDAEAVLAGTASDTRARLLARVAEDESEAALERAIRRFRGVERERLATELLGSRARSARHLAILHAAWSEGAPTDESLRVWLERYLGAAAPSEVSRLRRAYDNPRLTLADFAYLLGRRPLDVWVAGELYRTPGATPEELRERSAEPRRVAWDWLFAGRNRRAQDRRLRIRVERDAFEAMTPHWQRLGFPFARLVPSLATSIGSSADRPAALAELVRIIQAGGRKVDPRRFEEVRFAAGTPYHTRLRVVPAEGEAVMDPAVAAALRGVLAGVVERGTARRLHGAFRGSGADPVVGGKTGSGDNRAGGRVLNRTATFAFFVGERYHGVVTAFVPGPDARHHRFTSALPVSIVRLAAPAIAERLAGPGAHRPASPSR